MTRLARRAVKAAASAADRLRPPAPGIVILVYHRVGGDSGLDVDLDPAVFEDQIAAVAGTGRACTLGDALARLASGAAAGGAAGGVVVTFDDGTADFVDAALPVLARYAVPVTLYLATSFAEDGRELPGGGRPVSWGALADACTTGLVDVGSHTHRHRLLDRLGAAQARDELDRSIELIGSRLGRRALDFAYPKAVAGSPSAARLVRERFRSAALAGTRPNVPGRCDPYRLARSPIQASDGMTYFARKLAGGMALEDGLRRVVNRVRYAGARS